MIRHTIVDAGPLVALLRESDERHAWAANMLSGGEPPYQTCEAVVTEACFILHRTARGTERAAIELLDSGCLAVSFSLQQEAQRVEELMRQYASVPMSLADACVVRMSELHSNCLVVTFDTDFHIYRRYGRQSIPLLMP